jgi:hypothetical protein
MLHDCLSWPLLLADLAHSGHSPCEIMNEQQSIIPLNHIDCHLSKIWYFIYGTGP